MHPIAFIEQHEVLSVLIFYYVFSSVVSALPSPDEKDGKGYRFLFAVMHAFAGNLARLPQVRSLIGQSQAQTPAPPEVKQ